MSYYGTQEFAIKVALGQVPGWESFRKFGMNDDVDSGTEYMWPPGTARTLPTSAAAASVTGGAADVLTSGTGAWTLTIQGLDSSLLEVEETINMNGASAVTTTQTFLRINRAFVVTAGTDETNNGAISITVGGDLQAYIEADEGQTHQTFYTVPSNKTLLVTYFNLSTGRLGSADLAVLSQVKLTGSDTAWRTISDVQVYEGLYFNSSSVTVIPASTEIRQKIVSTATNGEAAGIFGGFLVET
jgi:hypothetical protein